MLKQDLFLRKVKQLYTIYIEIVIVAPNRKYMQLSAILNTNRMAQFSIQLCI